MVFQSYALFPHMSVLDNVAYGLISSGVRNVEAHEQAEEAVSTVGLKGFAKTFAFPNAARGLRTSLTLLALSYLR
jgi:ABC-type proline/glycine betaine transport system ATPase subunit